MRKYFQTTTAVAGVLALGWCAFGAAKPGNVAKGKDVFDTHCAVCHNADSAEKKMGPGLKGLFKKAAMANKKKPTEPNVTSMIDKGSEAGMLAFADMLTDQEKADLIAYLKTL